MPMGTVGLSSFAPHGDVLVLTSNQLFFLDGTSWYLRLEMNECLSIAQVEASVLVVGFLFPRLFSNE